MPTNVCAKCGADKTAAGYYKSQPSYCKTCVQANNAAWVERNKKKVLAYRADWMRERRKKHPEKVLGWELSQRCRKYGTTAEWYEKQLAKQGGVCAICKQPEKKSLRGVQYGLAIDHDHKTGKVRGLICCACNTCLHGFDAHPDWPILAATYLKKHR